MLVRLELTIGTRSAGVEEQEVVVDRNNPLQRWTTFLLFAASQVLCRTPPATSHRVSAQVYLVSKEDM